MKKNESDLFMVTYSWYEDFTPTIVKSPEPMTNSAFNKLCRSLLNHAADVAIKEAGKNDYSWVGFHDIIDSLVELLQNKGFEVLKLHSFGLWGSNIINKEDDFENCKGFSKACQKRIMTHNKKLETEQYERLEEYEKENS